MRVETPVLSQGSPGWGPRVPPWSEGREAAGSPGIPLPAGLASRPGRGLAPCLSSPHSGRCCKRFENGSGENVDSARQYVTVMLVIAGASVHGGASLLALTALPGRGKVTVSASVCGLFSLVLERHRSRGGVHLEAIRFPFIFPTGYLFSVDAT